MKYQPKRNFEEKYQQLIRNIWKLYVYVCIMSQVLYWEYKFSRTKKLHIRAYRSAHFVIIVGYF